MVNTSCKHICKNLIQLNIISGLKQREPEVSTYGQPHVFGTSDMENRADTIVGFTEINKYVYPDTLQTIVSSFQCSPNDYCW